MLNVKYVLGLMVIVASQQIFADDMSMSAASEGKSCSAIADACLAAGYVKGESADKGIWKDCMRPIILGKTVTDVKIEAAVAKACRKDKIAEMKAELKEFQAVK